MQIVSSPPLLCTVVLLLFLSFLIIYLLLRHSGSRRRASALSSGHREINSAKHEEPAGGIYGVVRSEKKQKTHNSVQAQPCKDARAKRQKAANSREPSEAETGGSRNRCGRFCISSCFALKKGKKRKKKKKVPVWPRTPLTPPPHPSFRRHQRGEFRNLPVMD